MEIRIEWKVRSKGNRTERQKPWKRKGKQSVGKNGTETQKEKIWDITLSMNSPWCSHVLNF